MCNPRFDSRITGCSTAQASLAAQVRLQFLSFAILSLLKIRFK
jgi:hypothetical protein